MPSFQPSPASRLPLDGRVAKHKEMIMSRTFTIIALSAALGVTAAAYADESKSRWQAPRMAVSYRLTKPLHGTTLWFADRHASVYYTVDPGAFEVVTTIIEGPSGSNPMQTRMRLGDGETNTLSIGGYGHDARLTTLHLTRAGDELKLRRGERLGLTHSLLASSESSAKKPQGFGTRLINNIMHHELGGRVELSLPPQGARHARLECRWCAWLATLIDPAA
jgi:hypothetical protein